MAALSSVDIRRELDKNIVIEKFCDKCLTPIGYDLRIGAAYSPGVNQEAVSGEGNTILIKSGKMLQILCDEFVWLSPSIAASIHSRGSFSAKGLVLNSTTVDPNWSGQMAFALFNFSNEDIELKIGERFATMLCYYCNSPTMDTPMSRAVEGVQNTAFSSYEHSSEISKRKSEFEKKKQKAQMRPIYLFRSLKQNIFSGIHSKLSPKTLLVILFVISLVSLIGLPAGLYGVLQAKFGWVDYNLAYFLSNAAICVSLLVAITKN